LTLYEKGELVLDIKKRIKSRVVNLIKAKSFDKAYLRVSYGRGLFNSGLYTSRKGLVHALNAFTEKNLLEEIKDFG